jgi:hypothetical protein
LTLGIGAYGSEAGRAVLDGLTAAEALGRGSIGGFAVLSFLDAGGHHRQISCQDGGVAALGECAGIEEALCAAVISSGPNRPEPLSQFLSGRDHVGLVTGHRLPNRPGKTGVAINVSTLDRIEGGEPAEIAVQAMLAEHPELDLGLVAVTPHGGLGFGNTARVNRRDDLMEASFRASDHGFALLGNSIYFSGRRARDAVAGIVRERLTGQPGSHFLARLAGSVPVVDARSDRIELDVARHVVRIFRAEPWAPQPTGVTTAIPLRAEVWQGGRCVGHCASEVFARLGDGHASPERDRRVEFAVERTGDVTA